MPALSGLNSLPRRRIELCESEDQSLRAAWNGLGLRRLDRVDVPKLNPAVPSSWRRLLPTQSSYP